MKIVHKELEVECALMERSVQLAINELIDIIKADNVPSIHYEFILECSLYLYDQVGAVAFTQKAIPEVRLVKDCHSRYWKVIYYSATTDTQYSVGSTPQ